MPAPTVGPTADLVEGNGTRAFSAVTTQAGDWVVVQVQVESDQVSTSDMTPSASGLAFSTPVATTASGGSRARIFIFAAQDASGASRTVTITPNGGSTLNYRGRLTVVRGSSGLGAAAGTNTAQTVSLARQGNNSMITMGVSDWSTGAIGSPVWTPGGSTVASQQGAAGTYIFGRWDDSGAAATAAHGISSPSYGTPASAALELLGTAGSSPVQDVAKPGPTWRRRFRRQFLPPLAASTAGPAVFTGDAADTAIATDAATGSVLLARSATDAAAATDAATRTSTRSRAASDTAAATDAAIRALSLSRATSETAAATDVAAGTVFSGQFRTASDTAAATDVATRTLIQSRTAPSTATATDAATRTSARTRTTADAAAATDVASRSLTLSRPVADTAAATDAGTRSSARSRSLSDTAIATDTATGTPGGGQSRTAADTAVATDVATRAAQAFSRTAPSTAAATDVATRAVARTRATSDTAIATDAVTKSLVRSRTATDVAVATDVATRAPRTLARTAADTALAVDVAVSAATGGVTYRPFSGTTGRPGTGTTARPFTGTTSRP